MRPFLLLGALARSGCASSSVGPLLGGAAGVLGARQAAEPEHVYDLHFSNGTLVTGALHYEQRDTLVAWSERGRWTWSEPVHHRFPADQLVRVDRCRNPSGPSTQTYALVGGGLGAVVGGVIGWHRGQYVARQDPYYDPATKPVVVPMLLSGAGMGIGGLVGGLGGTVLGMRTTCQQVWP